MRHSLVLIALALGACGQSERWVAIDGDTIARGDERIRLVGIDAPEMPGHCRPGRRCVEGDPYEARDALQRLLDISEHQISCTRRPARDVYGRTLATCRIFYQGVWLDVGQGMVDLGYAQPYRRP